MKIEQIPTAVFHAPPCSGSLDLRLGDCMDVMATFPDGHFDLAIVDPPYGIGVDGKNLIANPSDAANKTMLARDHKWDDAPPPPEYFHELRRVAKEQIVWGGNYFLDHLGYCKAPIVWDKLNGASMYADGEMAWTSKGLPKNLKIWRHQWCGAFKDSERGVKRQHPTQKPVALYKWILANYAKPGQRVLDTHMGSGSIAIEAHYAGIHLTACEIDADYYEAAKARIARETSQTELFSPQNSLFGSIKGMEKSKVFWKHKYLMPLDNEMRKKIIPLSKPYPKRAGSDTSDTPAFQAGEGGSLPTPALHSQPSPNP